MATPVHEPDVLRAVADSEPGSARDWALSRLALMGITPPHLPDDLHEAEICLAAAPPGIVDLVVSGIERAQPSAPYMAMRLGAYGLLPRDEALAEALRRSLGSGDLDDLIRVRTLADLGALTTAELRVASQAHGQDRLPWILPLLLLKCASPDDLEDTATAIADGLAEDSDLLRTLLVQLGVPLFASSAIDPDDAVQLGARLAGTERVPVRQPKGGAARREQAWVRALLRGHPGPAAALLRAIYRKKGPRGLNGALGAAWLKMAQRDSPVSDVLRGGFGADPVHLSAARSELTSADAQPILEHLVSPAEPVAVLAAALMPEHPSLSQWFVDALRQDDTHLGDRAANLRWLAGSLQPDAVEALLRDDRCFASGIELARYTQTEEVLAALLDQRLPWDTEARVQLARALAATADPSAARPLRDLCATDRDPRIGRARRNLERLLNQPV